MAEVILDREGNGRFRAFSAGSQPKDAPHPTTLEVLARNGHDVTGVRSKSWDEFADPDAPKMDFVSPFATTPPPNLVQCGRASR